MSVTLGPCPGLAGRCPRHKTNNSSLLGLRLAAPQGGLGSVSDVGVCMIYIFPRQRREQRNPAHHTTVPRGTGATQGASWGRGQNWGLCRGSNT